MSMPEPGRRYAGLMLPAAVLSLAWIALGLAIDTPAAVLAGLRTILLSADILYTDYMATVGVGAAFANAGLMCLVSLAILYCSKDTVNGFTLATLGLMAGFSLFGKNLANSLPIFLGAALYAKLKREPFGKYATVSLLATALSPMVSYLAFHKEAPMPLAAMLVGMLIGFVMPPLAAYTFRIQNGMNLYNVGFACGILGLVLVPILTAMNHGPEMSMFWAEEYTLPLGLGMFTLCALLIMAGTLRGGRAAWRQYRYLLHTSGRLPSDYLRAFGLPAVCVNMGINGLLGILYIVVVGGDFNGPTVGAVMVVMGFSAYGKHARNIAPVMLGVLLGNCINHVPLDNPTMQIAGLFGTTLAPISGVFGWPFGILAGILHSSVVLYSGAPVAGLNLYNNGFSGGVIATVLYPILTALVYHRKPALQDEDYYDIFEDDSPIPRERLEAHRGGEEEEMPH